MAFGNAKHVWLGTTALALALGLTACGGGSELDEYDDGVVPDIIPKPEAKASVNGVGAACTTDKSCTFSKGTCTTQASLFGVSNITFTGGYCSAACSASVTCPTGSTCVTGANKCIQTCTTNDTCRVAEGYACQTMPAIGGTVKYCLPKMSATGGLLGGLFGGLLGSETPAPAASSSTGAGGGAH